MGGVKIIFRLTPCFTITEGGNRDVDTRVDMQHEVLLALSGYPGNVFTVCRETGLFEVKCAFYSGEEQFDF